jgi:DnaJ family protein C protein 7
MEDETLILKAEMLKNKGNEAFKRNNYQQAIELYSEAIDCYGNEPAFYTNRAIAYLKAE